jgi:hypothetical protein
LLYPIACNPVTIDRVLVLPPEIPPYTGRGSKIKSRHSDSQANYRLDTTRCVTLLGYGKAGLTPQTFQLIFFLTLA